MIQQGLTLLADCVREPVSALAMLGYLFYLNWKLTCLVLVAAPVVIIVSKSLGRSVRKYSFIQQEVLELFTNVLKETLRRDSDHQGLWSGRAHGEAFQIHHGQGSWKFVEKSSAARSWSGLLFELFAAMTFAGILYFAGFPGRSKERRRWALLWHLSSFSGPLQRPIQKLQDAHVRLQHTIAASERIFEVLDRPQTVKSPTELGRKPISLAPELEHGSVSKCAVWLQR
jgi:ATP-binding cassette, subfamily B, bacterial MsbA